jgi:hypothetical protein
MAMVEQSIPKPNFCEEPELWLCPRVFRLQIGETKPWPPWIVHQMLPRGNPKVMYVQLYYD